MNFDLNSGMRRSVRTLLAAGLALGLVSTAVAQPAPKPAPKPAPAGQPEKKPEAAPSNEKLPTAQQVLDKYIEATGGRQAYLDLKSRVTQGNFEMAAMGIKGTVNEWKKAPNLSYSVLEIPGFGKTESGYDGKTLWMKSETMGTRVIEGPEKEMMLRTATLTPELNQTELYKTIEVVGVEDVNGKSAYKLVFTPAEGKPETRFYEKESGLLVKQVMTVAGQGGSEIPVTGTVGDYKKVGSLLVAHSSTQTAGGIGEQKATLEKVEDNVEIPDSKFELPQEIKDLLAKSKGEAKPEAAPTAPEKK